MSSKCKKKKIPATHVLFLKKPSPKDNPFIHLEPVGSYLFCSANNQVLFQLIHLSLCMCKLL